MARTGTVCVVESEDNGRMCLALAKVLISVMGIAKVIPAWQDFGIVLQVLPRSSTGQRMSPYTSIWTRVTKANGPQSFHHMLLDNGRTQVWAGHVGRPTLNSICSSPCLNLCPAHERTGADAYGSVCPGPICAS